MCTVGITLVVISSLRGSPEAKNCYLGFLRLLCIALDASKHTRGPLELGTKWLASDNLSCLFCKVFCFKHEQPLAYQIRRSGTPDSASVPRFSSAGTFGASSVKLKLINSTRFRRSYG